MVPCVSPGFLLGLLDVIVVAWNIVCALLGRLLAQPRGIRSRCVLLVWGSLGIICDSGHQIFWCPGVSLGLWGSVYFDVRLWGSPGTMGLTPGD